METKNQNAGADLQSKNKVPPLWGKSPPLMGYYLPPLWGKSPPLMG